MVTEKYKSEGIEIDDPDENPFHEDLKALPRILQGMVERTRESQQNGDKYIGLTLVIVDDLMANTGGGGYQYNNDLLKLMSTSRHSGGGGRDQYPVVQAVGQGSASAGHAHWGLGRAVNAVDRDSR